MLKLDVIGNIGQDVQVKETNGKKFASFSVATSKKWKDKEGNDHESTTWINCFIKPENKVIPFLKKGTKVFVTGSPNFKIYEGKDNQSAIDVSMQVAYLELLSKKQEDNSTNANNNSNTDSFADVSDDLPFD